ncbi:MAG: hypothetical protein A2234_05790 [Elusimicrobia bacterium RIFOXYA2_FULL_58_8]|nr:MAG: hypothetical protein A2285_02510 [Elusimicrobia bacterium RIFOXYA12_FULL_57_11]OGS13817.1 MAG: hypothetical protein A2234_05790 [Elusimicrobia bacterium RIFOXYA2_FULL_58_8]
MEEEIKECRAAGPGAADIPMAAMFCRSFFIQAGWNYERFQNLGFVFSLLPALRRIYPDKAGLKNAILRHMEIFNTQPYMANFVLGNVARMEAGAAASLEPDARLKNMPGVKQALASSFASIGDRVFWGRLKPMTTQVCLLVWTLAGFYGWLFTGRAEQPSLWLVFAGPLAGILGYSAVAVYLRWIGLKKGYACGGTASCGLDAVNWPGIIRFLSAAGFAFSMVLALLAFGLLIVANYGACSTAELMLKLGLGAGVLVLHRVARAYGRSAFFAAGFILAVSVLVFSVFRVEPFKMHI